MVFVRISIAPRVNHTTPDTLADVALCASEIIQLIIPSQELAGRLAGLQLQVLTLKRLGYLSGNGGTDFSSPGFSPPMCFRIRAYWGSVFTYWNSA